MKIIEPSFKGMATSGSLKGRWVFGTGLSFVPFTESYKKEKGREGDWYLDVTDHVCHVVVDEDTIGQFIGKIDAEGEKIYSGDSVSVTFKSGTNETCNVFYDEKSASFRLKRKRGRSIGFGYAIAKLELV